MMITGGCLCGAVRYQCRRITVVGGTLPLPRLPTIVGNRSRACDGRTNSSFGVQGETKTYATRGTSGGNSIRHFCPTCGSLLFGTSGAAPDAVSIYVGTLDDPSVFKPEAVMFKRDRHPWDITAGTLTEFDTMPPSADRVKSELLKLALDPAAATGGETFCSIGSQPRRTYRSPRNRRLATS